MDVVIAGDVVEIVPAGRRVRVAEVYWRDRRRLELVTTDGRTLYVASGWVRRVPEPES